VARQLRIYTMKPGRLDDWVDLFRRGTSPLRAEHGFELEAWTSPATNQFVWLVSREGSDEEFEAADRAYYDLPEHRPIHEEALLYLEKGESWLLEPLEF